MVRLARGGAVTYCEICEKPAENYPNFVLSHGARYHVGCLATDYRLLKEAHTQLLDRANAAGIWGPWHDEWEESYDSHHWGED